MDYDDLPDLYLNTIMIVIIDKVYIIKQMDNLPMDFYIACQDDLPLVNYWILIHLKIKDCVDDFVNLI